MQAIAQKKEQIIQAHPAQGFPRFSFIAGFQACKEILIFKPAFD
jgi:hypothetical protein